ncbi:MAG: PQQ-binding-like beta-propeller repeat protein [Gemmataceae bacterium]
MHRNRFAASSILAATLILSVASLRAGDFDWPQWQGPERTGQSRETGLLKSWPKDGPPLVWKTTNLGGGYSTPSVADGRIFGMSYRGNDEVVWALNEADGKELWATKIADKGRAGYNEGSRCSPTVDGKNLYVLGISGDLACLDAATGKILWQKNLQKDLGARMMSGWGFSESPLVDGDLVICSPGGKNGAVAAFDKQTGKLVWQTKDQPTNATYSSVIVATVGGKKHYIQNTYDKDGFVIGIDPKDGSILWKVTRPGWRTAVIPTPIFHDNHVFVTAGYGAGCDLIKLTPDGSSIKAEKVIENNKNLANHHGGVVLIDGKLYGSSGQLTCMDFKTGKMLWRAREAGKGSIAYADGHLYYRDERGPIMLVEVNPDKYVEKSRFVQPDQSGKRTWPHPVIANGKLYIRDQDVLLCYDVKAKK